MKRGEEEEEEGQRAHKVRRRRPAEDLYWTTLPEMRGEVGTHMTAVERFQMLMTRKSAYTVDAQREILVNAMWDDIIEPMYAKPKQTVLMVPFADNTMGVFDTFNKKVKTYLEATPSVTLKDKDAPTYLFREPQCKQFLRTLSLSELKQLYAGFISDMSYAMGDLLARWLRALFVAKPGALYKTAKENEPNHIVHLAAYILDRNDNILYELVLQLHAIWHEGAEYPSMVPSIFLRNPGDRPYRLVTQLELDRVETCQELLDQLFYDYGTDTIANDVKRLGFVPLLRTLLYGVDAGIGVQLQYDVFDELGISDAQVTDNIVKRSSPDEDYISMSRASQMSVFSYKKAKHPTHTSGHLVK